MTLFEHRRKARQSKLAPLAARMRPRSFDEFVGQDHLLGPDRVLRRSIEADQVPSMVLWGPPGSGKTTLAFLIATISKSHFSPVSAVSSGVADLRRVIDQARERLAMNAEELSRTLLFIDEIHRFNKAQQDVILPYVEDGTVTLVGATTENPSFEVIAPLLSRCRVFTLNPLGDGEIRFIIEQAIEDEERGFVGKSVKIAGDAIEMLITVANGDARVALNALELAVNATEAAEGSVNIHLSTIEDALHHTSLYYDKQGEQHYDTISAFIKSVRGSDPDAALYWLARMIEAGEDPMFICRRIVILAAEDIGMADPMALPVAVACQQAVHFVGMPEGRIPLAETTVYLATAPKSNAAYMGLSEALRDVRQRKNEAVPLHLRNAATELTRNLGYAQGYMYSHDYEGHFKKQDFLPQALQGKKYYDPSSQGYERQVLERLQVWWGDYKDVDKKG